MQQTHRTAYSELYSAYGQGSESVPWVRSAIETVSARLWPQSGGLPVQRVRLREDAKYFLLVNLTEMVVKPLQGISQARLQAAVDHDLQLLLSAAAHMANSAEISGHAVVDALSRVWSQLEINHFGLWN